MASDRVGQGSRFSEQQLSGATTPFTSPIAPPPAASMGSPLRIMRSARFRPTSRGSRWCRRTGTGSRGGSPASGTGPIARQRERSRLGDLAARAERDPVDRDDHRLREAFDAAGSGPGPAGRSRAAPAPFRLYASGELGDVRPGAEGPIPAPVRITACTRGSDSGASRPRRSARRRARIEGVELSARFKVRRSDPFGGFREQVGHAWMGTASRAPRHLARAGRICRDAESPG